MAISLDGHTGRRGLGTLLRDLVEGSTTLVRDEVRLAKIELNAAVKGISVGTALVATGATLGMLGALALVTGLVLLVGDQWLPKDLYWLAALIVLVVAGALAAVFVNRGKSRLSPSQLAPNETLTTLQEDKEWLKRRLTSDATSS